MLSRPVELPSTRALMTLALALSVLAPARLGGQELRAHVISGASGPDAFDSSRGFGAAFGVDLAEWASLQVSLETRTHSTREDGYSCAVLDPPQVCEPDRLTIDSRFNAVTVSGLASLPVTDALRLGAGAGLVIGRTSSDPSGERDDRRPGVYDQATVHVGALLLLEARIYPLAAWPVFVTGQLQGRYIDLNACTQATARLLTPFCSSDVWTDLHIGIGVHL